MTNKLEQIEGQVRDKVDSTVSQAKRVVDVRQHVNERPWLSLGAAVMAGYFLGSMGGDDRPEPAAPRPGEPMRYYAVDGNGRDEERRGAQQAQHGVYRSNSQPYEGQRHEAPYYQRRSQMSSVVSQIVDPLRSEISLIATAALRSGMRALREKRVCLFNRDEADMLVRPGPRMADGARLMARCIADKARTP